MEIRELVVSPKRGREKPEEGRWERHGREFRQPEEVISAWEIPSASQASLFAFETTGDWWGILRELNLTLIVSREYEHLLQGLRTEEAGNPSITYIRMPHPSGIAVNPARNLVHLACTRNPNQIYDFMPVNSLLPREDTTSWGGGTPLIPVNIRCLPGCYYIHDIAVIGDVLHANSVGQNCVVRLDPHFKVERVWWPRSIDTAEGPLCGRNHLQLNSIAAGEDLESSFFTASSAAPLTQVPGDLDFPVDGTGVIFCGGTREVWASGLTRPHSARLYRGDVWVDNSGYGEVGVAKDGGFEVVARLPGWTRGLSLWGDIAFVGTSRILPRFHHYAPGLDPATSQCGVHAVHTGSGEVLGSISWPGGNQVFGIECVPESFTTGLPFLVDGGEEDRERVYNLFYAFDLNL